MPGDGVLRCKGIQITWLHGGLTARHERSLAGSHKCGMVFGCVPKADGRGNANSVLEVGQATDIRIDNASLNRRHCRIMKMFSI